MGARDRYEALEKDLVSRLREGRPDGWTLKGKRLVRSSPTHVAAVRFLTSRWCDDDEHEFAVEGALTSLALLPVTGGGTVVEGGEGHWSRRLAPTGSSWYTVPSQGEVPGPDELLQQLRDDLLPDVEQHMSDRVLLDGLRPLLDGPRACRGTP